VKKPKKKEIQAVKTAYIKSPLANQVKKKVDLALRKREKKKKDDLGRRRRALPGE